MRFVVVFCANQFHVQLYRLALSLSQTLQLSG